jgi:hypothetical protein
MCSPHKKNEGYGTERSVHEKIKDGPTEMEKQEWYMELRTNNVCMDELTSDVRMEKIKDLENAEAERRQDRDRKSEERDRLSEERDRMSDERERTAIAREKANEEKERQQAGAELCQAQEKLGLAQPSLPSSKKMMRTSI